MYQPRVTGQFFYWNTLMIGFAIIPAFFAFYSAYGLLFRKFLASRKILKLVMALTSVCLLSVAFGQFLLYSLFPNRINWSQGTVIGMGVVMLFNAALNGMAGLGIKAFITWYRELRWKEELTQKNHEMELALIRMQLSPHFLFNTINNIDTMIGQDPEKASVYLNKLSQIMRFMLYESGAKSIPLTKELSYIKDYINLQQIRSSNTDYVRYSTSGSIEGIQIPPMLFIPFIENAFKHSTPQKTGNVIRITIAVEHDCIHFECSNISAIQDEFRKEYSGLGNELIERRLTLLYNNNHHLAISLEDGIYHVKITIPLTLAV